MRPLVFTALLVVGSGMARQPPNVVMIMADDRAWIDIGFMGHEVSSTTRFHHLR